MKQKAALCLSLAALAVTTSLCLSPPVEKNQTSDTAVASSEQNQAPSKLADPNERRADYFVNLEQAKRLLDEHTFLFPTDQMYRNFDIAVDRVR